MKRIFLVLAKLALGGLFLYNIGLFNIKWPKFENIPVDQISQQQLNEFIRERVKTANSKGVTYSPDNYFDDLIAIEEKMKTLPNTYEESFFVNQICNRSVDNRHRGYFTDQQTQAAVARYKDYRDPGRESREMLQSKIAQEGFWVVLKNFLFFKLIPWLWHFYLKTFLLGLALIWIWWYQEYKTWRIKNPVSFILSVLAYPYFISRVVYKRLNRDVRYFTAEVELRKTKTKFFTLLSSNEISELRHYADSKLKMKDWRRYLADYGLVAKQSLAQALLATVLFSFISILSSGIALGSEKTSLESKVTIEQSDPGPPGPSYESLISPPQNSSTFYLIVNNGLNSIQLSVSQDISWRIFERRLLYRFQFYQKIKHIPVLVNCI